MKTTIYGYVRISTMKQKLQRQIDNIKALYPEAVIIDETYTGTTTDRPKWNKLVEKIRKESAKGTPVMLVFDEVSRMSRNAKEGYAIYEELFNMGVELQFIKEPYLNTDTIRQALNNRIEVSVNTGNSATDDFINGMVELLNKFAMDMVKENIVKAFASAEAEVEYLHRRTSEGVRKAMAEGKTVGRSKGAVQGVNFKETKKATATKEIIMKHSKDFNGTLNDAEVMKLADVARNTYYKYKAELKSIPTA